MVKNVVWSLIFVVGLIGQMGLIGQTSNKYSGADFMVKYRVTVTNSGANGEITTDIMAMMPKTMTMYVSNKKTCMEMITPFINQRTIINAEKKEIITVIDASLIGQKFAITAKESDFPKEIGMKIEKTGETKVIAGYNCEEVKLTSKDISFTAYTTDDIGFKGMYMDNPIYAGIEGCLLDYDVEISGINVKVTATSVDRKAVDKSVFSVPADYKRLTMKEAEAFIGKGF